MGWMDGKGTSVVSIFRKGIGRWGKTGLDGVQVGNING